MGQPTPPPQPQPETQRPALLRGVPAALLTLAALHRIRQQALAGQLSTALGRLWASLNTSGGVQASWDRSAGRPAVQVMSAVKAEAARGAQEYVAEAAHAWGAQPDPVGQVAAQVFGQSAADGRPLEGLLSYPAFEVDAFVAQGMDRGTALSIGQRHLERIALTEVQDAARVATGVAQVNDRTVTGYVRMLTPPSCSRCAVLAGRFYKTNTGFQRHPLCDCVMIPAVEHLPEVATDPKAYFDSLTPDEQNRVFTSSGAQAVRDGADVAQVVNARRGMSKSASGRLTTASVYGRPAFVTSEGTTRRSRGLPKIRLMPEQIYLDAGGSRDEAIRLLKLHGYIL